MSEERRQNPRVAYLFDAQWHAGSGATHVRVGDLSVGGCFVQSLAMPKQGETTSVTVTVGDRAFTFSGQVVYLDPGIGFSVKFAGVSDDDAKELTRLLAEVRK